MGSAASTQAINHVGFTSTSGTIHVSLSPTNEKARDRSVLLFSELLVNGYCCTKTPTAQVLDSEVASEVMRNMHSNLCAAEVVVVCISPDTINDPLQMAEILSTKEMKREMIYVPVDSSCAPNKPGNEKIAAIIDNAPCYMFNALADRFEVKKKIAESVGDRCKKEILKPERIFETPDGNDKYWGQVNADGEKHGYGRCVYAKPVGREYIGDFTNGKRNGTTVIRYPNGNMFIGSYKMEKWHGNGIMIYSDGDTFEGSYKDGVRAGYGVFIKTDGEMFQGTLIDDSFSKGTYSWPDGGKYVGEFQNNAFHGEGIMYNADGSVEYEGQYVDGNEAA